MQIPTSHLVKRVGVREQQQERHEVLREAQDDGVLAADLVGDRPVDQPAEAVEERHRPEARRRHRLVELGDFEPDRNGLPDDHQARGRAEEVDEPENVELAVPDDLVRGPVGLGRGGGRRRRRIPAGRLVPGGRDLEHGARAADSHEHDRADGEEGVREARCCRRAW